MEETHTMENIIFNELKLRGYNVDVGVVPVNYTTKGGDAFKKIIITKDTPAKYYNDDGVLIMGIYDFLLNKDSLDW